MAGWTNKGKFSMMEEYFRATGAPTVFYVALLTSATVPDADTNVMSDVSEVTAGNGYTTGGIAVSRTSTGFDVLTESDASDYSQMQVLDVVWTASGGNLPASGTGAVYAVLTDDNATVASREIYAYWSLTSARTVSDGQTLTLADLEMRVDES